jgi:hypothetical protein
MSPYERPTGVRFVSNSCYPIELDCLPAKFRIMVVAFLERSVSVATSVEAIPLTPRERRTGAPTGASLRESAQLYDLPAYAVSGGRCLRIGTHNANLSAILLSAGISRSVGH